MSGRQHRGKNSAWLLCLWAAAAISSMEGGYQVRDADSHLVSYMCVCVKKKRKKRHLTFCLQPTARWVLFGRIQSKAVSPGWTLQEVSESNGTLCDITKGYICFCVYSLESAARKEGKDGLFFISAELTDGTETQVNSGQGNFARQETTNPIIAMIETS